MALSPPRAEGNCSNAGWRTVARRASRPRPGGWPGAVLLRWGGRRGRRGRGDPDPLPRLIHAVAVQNILPGRKRDLTLDRGLRNLPIGNLRGRFCIGRVGIGIRIRISVRGIRIAPPWERSEPTDEDACSRPAAPMVPAATPVTAATPMAAAAPVAAAARAATAAHASATAPSASTSRRGMARNDTREGQGQKRNDGQGATSHSHPHAAATTVPRAGDTDLGLTSASVPVTASSRRSSRGRCS
jgi:hypothetical protein